MIKKVSIKQKKETFEKGEVLFSSERCLIRAFLEKDMDDFIQYRNNLEWMTYQSFKGLSKEVYAKTLAKEASLINGSQLAIIRKEDRQLIGDIYLKKEGNIFWIGYTINPKYTRLGYALEIVKEIANWIKEQGDYKIMAGVAPENIPSINLLKKLNFIKVGIDEGDEIYILEK